MYIGYQKIQPNSKECILEVTCHGTWIFYKPDTRKIRNNPNVISEEIHLYNISYTKKYIYRKKYIYSQYIYKEIQCSYKEKYKKSALSMTDLKDFKTMLSFKKGIKQNVQPTTIIYVGKINSMYIFAYIHQKSLEIRTASVTSYFRVGREVGRWAQVKKRLFLQCFLYICFLILA